MRIGANAGKIAKEVIQHLQLVDGSTVKVTLEIEADIPDGAPDNVVRTVNENCRTLKIDNFGFEEY